MLPSELHCQGFDENRAIAPQNASVYCFTKAKSKGCERALRRTAAALSDPGSCRSATSLPSGRQHCLTGEQEAADDALPVRIRDTSPKGVDSSGKALSLGPTSGGEEDKTPGASPSPTTTPDTPDKSGCRYIRRMLDFQTQRGVNQTFNE
jgi:hypothetical protein